MDDKWYDMGWQISGMIWVDR